MTYKLICFNKNLLLISLAYELTLFRKHFDYLLRIKLLLVFLIGLFSFLLAILLFSKGIAYIKIIVFFL
jgi:hypothetical protein